MKQQTNHAKNARPKTLSAYLKTVIARNYKWFVLFGTLMISGAFTLRERAHNTERDFSASVEGARRYTALRAIQEDMDTRLRHIESVIETSGSSNPPHPDGDRVSRLLLGVVRTEGEAASRLLADKEEYFDLLPSKKLAWENEETGLGERINNLNKHLDTAYRIGSSTQEAVMKQLDAIEALRKEAKSIVDDVMSFDNRVYKSVIDEQTHDEIAVLLIDLGSSLMIACGVMIIVYAQNLGNPKEPPPLSFS